MQRRVGFNFGLTKNTAAFFSKVKLAVLINYCLDFPRKLVNPQYYKSNLSLNDKNKTIGKKFNPGLTLTHF